MDFATLSEKLMSMDDESWARHANPWSVYSRFTILPLISTAFYSQVWLGTASWFFIIASVIWIWVNPRLFNPPKNVNNWASRGTFGERLYLNRKNVLISSHHLRAIHILQMLSALGLIPFVYGLYSLDLKILVLGNLWVMAFKAWLVDRMVWLYMDAQHKEKR